MYRNDSLKFLINGRYTEQLWLSQGVKQGKPNKNKSLKSYCFVTGCNLSPLLFSLFINNLGQELNSSGLGIDLGGINVACISFADDLVLIGSSRQNLDKLITKTRTFFRTHHLSISQSKSKIMSFDAASGQTTFHDSTDHSSLTLDQVVVFKYLGVPLSSSPYSLFSSFNDQVKLRSQTYLSRVLSLVRSGPDRSDLAYSLWNQVALPSILYGAEVLPLTETTIKEVERCQSIVAKFILQVPRSTANVCSNIDAGFRPIWSHIAEKVLLYAHTVMTKPETFLPKLAMNETLQNGSKSPYSRYLFKWKQMTNSYDLHPKQIKSSVRSAAISSIMSQQNLTRISTFAMNPPGDTSIHQWFRPKQWVSDSGFSQIFSQFRSCNAGLGNRAPAKNGQYYKLCPLCEREGRTALNNEVNYKLDI